MPAKSKIADKLLAAADDLRDACNALTFAPPVHTVYNPLDYAWPMIEAYTRRFGNTKKRTVLFGMNPGPWGMAQTGVPFGEVAAVRDFLQLDEPIGKPPQEHPKRPITGLACNRSEVSGRRVWGLIEERFGNPDTFFNGTDRNSGTYIANFCPLVFMAESARNLTPDKLPVAEREPLVAACRTHLHRVLDVLEPELVIGVGVWAEAQAKACCEDRAVTIGRILHPSPASPAANRDWAGQATRQLVELEVWNEE
ncbi:MAG: uracil-DNA glycosylase family protein [Planctomycetota bacterium]